jgi:hypothetical protein
VLRSASSSQFSIRLARHFTLPVAQVMGLAQPRSKLLVVLAQLGHHIERRQQGVSS